MTNPWMTRIKSAILGMLLGGACVYMFSQYHLVWAADGIVTIPRQGVSYKDAFIDARGWNGSQWAEHPELVRALVADNRAGMVVRSAADEAVQKLFDEDEDESSGGWFGSKKSTKALTEEQLTDLDKRTSESLRAAFQNYQTKLDDPR